MDPQRRLRIGHHIHKRIEQAGFVKVSTSHAADWLQRHLLGSFPGVAVFDSQFTHPFSQVGRSAIFVTPGGTRIPGEDTKITHITQAELVYYWDLAEFSGFPRYYTRRLTIAKNPPAAARRADGLTHEMSMQGALKTNPRLTRLDLLLDPAGNQVKFAAVTYYMTDPRRSEKTPSRLKFAIGIDPQGDINFRIWDSSSGPIAHWRPPHSLEREDWGATNRNGIVHFGTKRRYQLDSLTDIYSLTLPQSSLRPLPGAAANPYARNR